MFKKVIFVSEENTFSSPVAAACLEKKFKGIEADSCGIVVLFPEPANPKAVAIAKSKGVDIEEHRAKGIEREMFDTDVLVLTMKEKTKAHIYEVYDNAVNVYTIKEFVGGSGDIETPYGKGLKEYGESYTMIEDIVEKVIEKLTTGGFV